MSLYALRALTHAEVEERDDEVLRREAQAHLAQSPPLQVVAELIQKLRSLELSWWTPAVARDIWPATVRMRWLKQRPDLRQIITTKLTGLPPKAARRFWPDEQASLIDAVVDNGDVDVDALEAAFDPVEMVVYGPAGEFWRAFRERMPWEENTAVHQKLVAWLIRALVADRSSMDGIQRKPILSALDVRSAIHPAVWQARIPFDLRVEIDQARIKHEKTRPREPFNARSELAIATPERIAENIPLGDLSLIVERAEAAMGFEDDDADRATDVPQSVEAPRPSQIN
jgi:hypothetical protein